MWKYLLLSLQFLQCLLLTMACFFNSLFFTLFPLQFNLLLLCTLMLQLICHYNDRLVRTVSNLARDNAQRNCYFVKKTANTRLTSAGLTTIKIISLANIENNSSSLILINTHSTKISFISLIFSETLIIHCLFTQKICIQSVVAGLNVPLDTS